MLGTGKLSVGWKKLSMVLMLQSFGMSSAIHYSQAKTKFSACRKNVKKMRRLQKRTSVRVKREPKQRKLISDNWINELSARFIRMSAYCQVWSGQIFEIAKFHYILFIRYVYSLYTG